MKTSYYLSGDHGWLATLIPLLIITMIGLVAARAVANYRGVIVTRLHRGEWLGVLPIAACVLVVVSKGLDAGLGSLARNNWVASDWVGKLSGGLEEISELFIPCVFLVTFGIAFRNAFFGGEMDDRFDNEQSENSGSFGGTSSGEPSSSDLPMAA